MAGTHQDYSRLYGLRGEIMKFLLHVVGSASGVALLFVFGNKLLALPSHVAAVFAVGGMLVGETLAWKLRHFHEDD